MLQSACSRFPLLHQFSRQLPFISSNIVWSRYHIRRESRLPRNAADRNSELVADDRRARETSFHRCHLQVTTKTQPLQGRLQVPIIKCCRSVNHASGNRTRDQECSSSLSLNSVSSLHRVAKKCSYRAAQFLPHMY